MLAREAKLPQSGSVITAEEFDVSLNTRQVLAGERGNRLLDLTANAPGVLQMAQDPVKGVARSGEWINDNDPLCRRGLHDAFDRASNQITKGVPHAFEGCARQQPDAAPIPLRWGHAVEGHVVGVGEAILAILLDLPKLHKLVALVRAEQERAVVDAPRLRA